MKPLLLTYAHVGHVSVLLRSKWTSRAKKTKKIGLVNLVLLMCMTAMVQAVTFKTNTLIDANDYTYDGNDIVVDECVLTINGEHQFNSLEVINSGVVTHSAAASGQVDYTIHLTITQDVNITVGSRISADGKGYGSASGPGAGESRMGAGGAGYGGVGGSNSGSWGQIYGSTIEPVDLGSGGGNDEYGATGGAGGGVIRLTVGGTLRIDGSLTTDGNNGKQYSLYNRSGGGGSGGSVYIIADSLVGSGVISANGGDAGLSYSGGGGGGGRIAIYYNENTFVGTLSAYGGSGGEHAGAGTVFTKSSSQAFGDLLIDNGGGSGLLTPITDTYTFDNLTISNGGKLDLDITEAVTVSDQLCVGGGGTVYLQTSITVGSMNIESSGMLTHKEEQVGFNVTVLNDANVDSGGFISADGKGYGSVSGPGAGASQIVGAGGAGYGGVGGCNSGSWGQTYGSTIEPIDLGSGGGNDEYGATGGAGGGVIRLTVGGTLRIDGSLTTDGDNGKQYSLYNRSGGGGSGGSVYITADSLVGSGVISANGGDAGLLHTGGGGGGGRIAIYFEDLSGFDLGSIAASGGKGEEAGQTGTVLLAGPDATPIVSVDTLSKSYLRNPFDHIDVVFTRPINPSTFTAEDIFIWGPNGEIPVTSIALFDEIASRETYRISIPLQETNGEYRVTISSDILGANGQPIEEGFEATFILDTVGALGTRHSPAGDVAGTVAYVDVWLSETIDTDTFTLDDISITGPSGNITPTDLTEIGINAFQISFDAQTTYGQYHMLVGPDVKDLAGNPMDQDRDGTEGEPNDAYDAWFNLTDVDLTLSNVVIGAGQLWAGEVVDINWDGSNNSGMPLFGDWTDAVYLSADDKWDIEDKLLVTVDHTGGLAQDEAYSQSVQVLIPGTLPGNYYIIVRADLYNEEKEGANEGDNVVAVGPVPLYVDELLADGLPVTRTLTDANWLDCYAVDTNSGDNLAITVDELDANAAIDFFVSYEKIPTRLDYDHRSMANIQGEQEVVIGGTLSGTYYLIIYGDQFTGASSYELTTDVPKLIVTSITPNHHGTGSVCTMTLKGYGFNDPNTAVEFKGSDESILTPTEVQIISPTIIIAVLDVPNWPLDVYDIIVTIPGVASHVLTDSFVVTTGVPHLDVRVIVPSGLGMSWPGTVWIEYANTGEASMPSPLFKLRGTDNAILTLDPSMTRRRLSLQSYPSGTSDTIQIMATGSGATPGILQPGDSGRIPVYYLGLVQPWDFSDSTIEFDLGILTTNSSESIDWPSLKDNMCPESMPADAWDAVWLNLTQQVGSTWGDYVAMLNENMNYLHTIGQDVGDVVSLFAFEMQQASALSPYTSLSVKVDAYSTAPGLPLVFARVYGQSINSRYELGPLGRGWRHNWDIYAEELSDGDVFIHGPLGIDRRFIKEARGYKASPGYYGKLTFANNKYCLTEKSGTIWQFRSNNLLDYVEDRNGNRITTGYTSGKLTSLTHSNGDSLTFSYSGGLISRVADPIDRPTTYSYRGEYLSGVTAPGNRITSYTYETAGTSQQRHALLSVEYPDNTHKYFVYDANGRLVQMHCDGGAEAVSHSYDSVGMVIVGDATGRQTALYFGLGGQLVQVHDGQGNVITLGYDRNYELTQLIGGSDQRYNYSYDSRGNMITVEDPLRHIAAFTYEPSFNKLASVTDPRGNGIDYNYDSSGNLLSITYEDSNSESFTYDASGNILTWTNRRGDTVTYTYNSRSQLTSKDYSTTPGPNDCTYAYDDAGNLISASDPCATVTMTYDPNTDWLTRIDYPEDHYFTFQYDDFGRRTQRTDQNDCVVKYIYDMIGRLDQITDGNDAPIVDYDYDSAGWLSRKTLGNGVYTTYEYDNAGRLTHLINRKSDDSIISRFDYTYDTSGRRTSMTTRGGTYTYGYDPLGQLISVIYPDSHIVEYVYDSVGNRIEVIDNGMSAAYTTNNMNQYTDVNGVTYTYDDDGNLKTKTEGGITTTYTYDIENRLIGVSTPTDTWEYKYDAFGNRISSTHNGITINCIVDPVGYGNVAAEYDESGNLVARYDHGFGLLSRSDPCGIPAYYTFDAVGSTSKVIDPTGTVLNSYAYDPFGISLSKSETILNPFQYVGEFGVMHEENGLEFMRARYYNPKLGRFIREDSIKTPSRNTYTYSNNNPVLFIDPKGLNWISEGAKKTLSDLQGPLEEAGLYGLPFDLEGVGELAELAGKQLGDPGSVDWDDLAHAAEKTLGDLGKLVADLSKFAGSHWDEWMNGLKEKLNDSLDWLEDLLQWFSRLRRSWDPNKKIAPAGYGKQSFVRSDTLMAYEIQFENMSDATAPAHMITIIDTLDDSLDLGTFELSEIVFADHTLIVPDGLNHYETATNLTIDNEFVSDAELIVEIDVSLDISSRELTFEMIGLDPNTGWLPEDIMLGILYPNDANGRGDGHISFTVKPVLDLPTGTQITNKASIKFDWNDELITPLVLNTIDSAPASSEVNPLPPEANDIFLTISWSGQDDVNGSGIAYYNVYVSDNGADYVLWLGSTTDTNATFVGEHGHSYSFYSIATDNVGNIEEVPIVADANITLYDQVPPQVVNTIINEGYAQRSRIGKLAVQFSENLVVNKDILNLYNDTNGVPVDLSVLTASDFSYDANTYTATWDLSPVTIEDGTHTATVLASAIIDTGGNYLDGDGNGVGGADDDYTFNFHRLFGDFDGGENIDFTDFATFAEKWQIIGCAEPYWCGGADSEPDGDLDFADLAALADHWLHSIQW